MRILLLILSVLVAQNGTAMYCDLDNRLFVDTNYDGTNETLLTDCDFDNEAKPAEKIYLQGCEQAVVRRYVYCGSKEALTPSGETVSFGYDEVVAFVSGSTSRNVRCNFKEAMFNPPHNNSNCIPNEDESNFISIEELAPSAGVEIMTFSPGSARNPYQSFSGDSVQFGTQDTCADPTSRSCLSKGVNKEN